MSGLSYIAIPLLYIQIHFRKVQGCRYFFFIAWSYVFFLWEVKVKVAQLRLTLCDPMGWYGTWKSPGQNTGMGSCSLFQGIFPTRGSNPGLPHCRQILYQLSHLGSPTTLEWVAYPSSSRSSPPRNQTGVSCIAGKFFTNWGISEAPCHLGCFCLKE